MHGKNLRGSNFPVAFSLIAILSNMLNQPALLQMGSELCLHADPYHMESLRLEAPSHDQSLSHHSSFHLLVLYQLLHYATGFCSCHCYCIPPGLLCGHMGLSNKLTYCHFLAAWQLHQYVIGKARCAAFSRSSLVKQDSMATF